MATLEEIFARFLRGVESALDLSDDLTKRIYEEHRKGCHKTGRFKECDAKRAVFLTLRDLKRHKKGNLNATHSQ